MSKLPKLSIAQEKIDINVKFYFFLKYLVKARLSNNEIFRIIEYYQLFSSSDTLLMFKEKVSDIVAGKTKLAQTKIDFLTDIFVEVIDDVDLKLFIFSLHLISIKDLLLAEAKVKRLKDLDNLKKIDPLSLEYDKATVFSPYTTRVNGALLSLVFFDGLKNGFFSTETDEYIISLSKQANYLLNKGVEPNQIFMLIFNESMNQSITSDSGSDYETRIKSVLVNLGIDKDTITKKHDKADKSTEFDFFFTLNNKTYGISAKRTLRERYKQFIKTAQMSDIDVMIEVTLGTDLTDEKVKSIRNHNVFLFVSDEIYHSNEYLKKYDGVYSCKSLSQNLLLQLAKGDKK